MAKAGTYSFLKEQGPFFEKQVSAPRCITVLHAAGKYRNVSIGKDKDTLKFP